MSNMKLTVDTLDNIYGSAVINIGANNGYVEAFIDHDKVLNLHVYNKQGDVVHEHYVPLKDLRAKDGGGYTTPTFQPAQD
jgi:uncharacterized protein YheU (UPF0270 family)